MSNATLASSAASGFTGTAASSIAFSAIDVLDGSGSLTGENAASVWTVNATPSYNDGSNTLAFSGFTTLDAGTGGDTFNVSGGASGYTLNGNTGSDTLTGVSNAVLSASMPPAASAARRPAASPSAPLTRWTAAVADRRERRQHLDGHAPPRATTTAATR